MLPELRSPEMLEALVCELGFLPFFRCGIAGFSIEECCPPELWFADDRDGPWEWKGPVARRGNCVYGKLFGGKAGFASLDWFPELANYRRNGYDFDARCDDGLVFWKDKVLYETLSTHAVLPSYELKRLCDYRKGGNTGFDTVITRLQMQTYVTVADFIYRRDKNNKPYGWGVAQYTTPEALFGCDRVTAAYRREPLESRARIAAHLKRLLPGTPTAALDRLIG